MSLSSLLLNIFLLAALMISAPTIIKVTKERYAEYISPRPKLGIVFFPSNIQHVCASMTALEALFKDESIKGIVLFLNDNQIKPGSAQSIYEEIEFYKKEFPKPIITFIENRCTGYAYWIACAGDTIVAPGAAIIGDIIAPQSDLPENVINDIEKQYSTVVALRRKLSLKTPDSWSKGVFSGTQASTIHLIDHVGSMNLVTKIVKEKALIDGEVEWIKRDLRQHPLIND